MRNLLTALLLYLIGCVGCVTGDNDRGGWVDVDDADVQDFTGGRCLEPGTWRMGKTDPSTDLLVTLPGGVVEFALVLTGGASDRLQILTNRWAPGGRTPAGEAAFPEVLNTIACERGCFVHVPLPRDHGDTLYLLPTNQSGQFTISDLQYRL